MVNGMKMINTMLTVPFVNSSDINTVALNGADVKILRHLLSKRRSEIESSGIRPKRMRYYEANLHLAYPTSPNHSPLSASPIQSTAQFLQCSYVKPPYGHNSHDGLVGDWVPNFQNEYDDLFE